MSKGVSLLEGLPPCVAPESPVLVRRGGQQFLIYQASDGFYHYPSTQETSLLSQGIAAYFTEGDDLQIPNSWLDKARGSYDRKLNQASWLIASGSGATQYTHRLVLDINSLEWTTYTYDNRVELSTVANVVDDNNQYLRLGGAYNGHVYEIDRDDCYDDAGYDIISIFERPYTAYRVNGAAGVGAQEVRALAFDYNLLDPSVSNLTGNTVYMTVADKDRGSSTAQALITLPDDQFKYNYPPGTLIGNRFKLKMRFTGPVHLFRQIVWARERGWKHAGTALLLADVSRRIFLEDGNGNAILWY